MSNRITAVEVSQAEPEASEPQLKRGDFIYDSAADGVGVVLGVSETGMASYLLLGSDDGGIGALSNPSYTLVRSRLGTAPEHVVVELCLLAGIGAAKADERRQATDWNTRTTGTDSQGKTLAIGDRVEVDSFDFNGRIVAMHGDALIVRADSGADAEPGECTAVEAYGVTRIESDMLDDGLPVLAPEHAGSLGRDGRTFIEIGDRVDYEPRSGDTYPGQVIAIHRHNHSQGDLIVWMTDDNTYLSWFASELVVLSRPRRRVTRRVRGGKASRKGGVH